PLFSSPQHTVGRHCSGETSMNSARISDRRSGGRDQNWRRFCLENREGFPSMRNALDKSSVAQTWTVCRLMGSLLIPNIKNGCWFTGRQVQSVYGTEPSLSGLDREVGKVANRTYEDDLCGTISLDVGRLARRTGRRAATTTNGNR